MGRSVFVRMAGWLAVAACGLLASAANASDSSVELPIGGLVFARNADVVMESQDLRISPQTVTIRYRLLNQGTQPATLAVMFPLPDIDMADPDVLYAIPGNDPVNFVDFETKVDGRPVKFDMRQQAFLGDKDVTEALRAAGLALLPMGGQQAAVDALAQQARDKLLADALLMPNGTDQSGKTLYSGGWTVKTSASREQVFPPGKPVTIEHSYRTSVGISFDTVLRKAIRESQAMEAEFKRYKTAYCIPDGMLRGIDRVAGASPANTVKLQERRIRYLLKSGAPDAAPIKDFRMVIDKGRADHLVSFCVDNIKKISPTAFEFRAKDFTPDRDINILLVTKPDGKVPVAHPDAPLLKQPPGRPERFE
jgi:hypothetical protein